MSQWIKSKGASKAQEKGLEQAAIRPLSHCERAFIGMRERLNRNAIKPLSRCGKALIANPKGKKTGKIPRLKF